MNKVGGKAPFISFNSNGQLTFTTAAVSPVVHIVSGSAISSVTSVDRNTTYMALESLTSVNAAGATYTQVMIRLYRNDVVYYFKYYKGFFSTGNPFPFTGPYRLVAGDSETSSWKVLDNNNALVFASDTAVSSTVFQTVTNI